jgi:hypothetical protein
MVEQGCKESRALRFQRVLQGGLLFGAYAFDCVTLIVIVAVTMVLSCFSSRCNPLYLFGLLMPASKPDTATGCPMDRQAEKFACALGLCFTATGLVLINAGRTFAGWSLVLLVGCLSVLAGTVGFCLGTVVYVTLLKKHGDEIQ